MDFFYSIVGFFSTGGLFMYPILLVFAVGVLGMAAMQKINTAGCLPTSRIVKLYWRAEWAEGHIRGCSRLI